MNREDFPILQSQVHGHPLVYLDNAATTQKPREVVEAIASHYYTANANVHRGVHHLSQLSTDLQEQARETVRAFLDAESTEEIIFTRGTTESINLVATSLGESGLLRRGDQVMLTEMEHHSNIVPWQLLRDRVGVELVVVPVLEDGSLDMQALRQLLTERVRLVSVAHVSNVLGTVNPVGEIARLAHQVGALVLVDGAQSVPHMAVSVRQLGCDFLAMSGHKVYGPTGIGVLYGRRELLGQMTPYHGGGEMISRVTWERTTYERLPYRFEAGTPNYVGIHALGVACKYVRRLGQSAIARHEADLTRYAMEQLSAIPSLRIYGQAPGKGAVVSFNVADIHPLDLGTLLDCQGIAIRTGHHCAQPLMTRYGVEGMARASFALYNTREEIDLLCEGIERARRMF